MMHKDLIVAVYARRRDGTYGIGTAYPVPDDLLLTARHVVEPDGCDPQAPLLLCWYHADGAGCGDAQRVEVPRDALVLPDDPGLDAALIRAGRPQALEQYLTGRLLERKPEDKEDWHSYGFARAEKLADTRPPGHFGGTVRSMADAEETFEILDDKNPIAADDWRGVSGMPVFARDGILGLAGRVPDGHKRYDKKALRAVPAWRIVRDAKLREALGLDDRDRGESARRLLTRCLDGEGAAATRRALAKALDIRGDETEPVVEHLLFHTPPLERLFDVLLRIKRRFAEERHAEARIPAALIRIVLPWLQDAALVSEICRRKGDSSVALLVLPTRVETLAEVFMAAADRRAASLRAPRTREDWPQPDAYLLPAPVEGGRDRQGRQFSQDWQAHLAEQLEHHLEQVPGVLERYLQERFLPESQRHGSEQDLRDAINWILHHRATDPGQRETYYFIVPMPEQAGAAADRERVLEAVKQQFPDIAFLRLDQGIPLHAEYRRYGPMLDLFHHDDAAPP